MYFSIFLTLLTLLLCSTVTLATALNNNEEESCPFEHTVNLTNYKRFDNGSYLYQDILIPPERQHFFDYHLKFLRARESVPVHLRGCVCENRPCIKLCCEIDEYFNDWENISRCEKMTPEMKVSKMPIQLKSGKSKVIDIFNHFTTQMGIPCQNLEALDYKLDKWTLMENGILFIATDDSYLDTLNYCFSPYWKKDRGKYEFTPFSCPIKNVADWKLTLNTYAMTVSVLFLIPTIAVYLLLKELRGNLRGKLLICYLISLTIGYAIISFINISGYTFKFLECCLLGFTCYFFFMAAFLWLSVLCYDIWKNFKETNVELNSRKNCKQFIFYSLYAWLSAALATLFLVVVQFSPKIDDIYKPGIGVEVCWLNTENWSAAIYFYGPNLFILLFNIITFAHLTARIYKVRRDMARMTQKEKFIQENVIVILRLFLIMGISWLFDILSYIMRDRDYSFLFVVSDFGNAIQGILIFSLFVLKPNVLTLLKKRFQKVRTSKPRGSVSTSTTNFSKLQSSTSAQPAITP